MVEQPPSILAHVASSGHKFLQDLLLVGRRSVVICRRNLME